MSDTNGLTQEECALIDRVSDHLDVAWAQLGADDATIEGICLEMIGPRHNSLILYERAKEGHLDGTRYRGAK